MSDRDDRRSAPDREPLAGPGASWAAFYLRHRSAIASYAATLTRDATAAADLMQDVLLTLVEQDPQARFPLAYVLQCLRRRAIDLHRRARAAQPLSSDPPAAAAADHVEQADEGERLRTALDGLAPAQREVVVLRVFAQLSFAEIADTLDCPLGTVNSHYRRGLAALRQRMSGPPVAARQGASIDRGVEP